MQRISSQNRVVSTYRERLLSLVLVPAVFFGTLPHTACICADGHREAFCQAMACRIAVTPPSEAENCCCCRAKTSENKTQNCCRGKQSRTDQTCELGAGTGSCCQPIVEAPSPVVISSKAELTMKSLVVAAIEAPNLFRFSTVSWPTLPLAVHSTPPPLDTVIVYLHLTI
jgi:hypothetical protein